MVVAQNGARAISSLDERAKAKERRAIFGQGIPLTFFAFAAPSFGSMLFADFVVVAAAGAVFVAVAEVVTVVFVVSRRDRDVT